MSECFRRVLLLSVQAPFALYGVDDDGLEREVFWTKGDGSDQAGYWF